MVRRIKSSKRLFRKHLRESSSEDELCTYFAGAKSIPTTVTASGHPLGHQQHEEEKALKKNEQPNLLQPRTLEHQNQKEIENDKNPPLEPGLVLTAKQMEHLRDSQYEYNAAAGSILEKFMMQRFWCWATLYVPLSIMPCTITAIGFALNLVTSSILIYYSPSATDPVPTWTLYLAALGVFLYQTADALDGKQCYKMQNSQIEEFYDHACDSVSTILLMYSIAISTNCGLYPTMLVVLIHFSLVAFWTTHWQCYITNQMIFGNIDVTEAQFVMIVTHLVSAVFGQQIWNTALFTVDGGYVVHANQLLALATLATLFRSIMNNCWVTVFGGRTPLEIVGALQFRRRTDTLKPLLPIVLLTLLFNVNWCLLQQQQKPLQLEQQSTFDNNHVHLEADSIVKHSLMLVTFVAIYGISTAKLTMRLVLAHCTNVDAPLFDTVLVMPTIQTLSLLTPISVPYTVWLMFLSFIVNSCLLTHFFFGVGIDMENAMDVKIFTLKYPIDHPKNRTSHKGIYINGLNNSAVIQQHQKEQ